VAEVNDTIKMTAAHLETYPEPTMRPYMKGLRWTVLGVYEDGDLRIQHLTGGYVSRVNASEFEVVKSEEEQGVLV
jgi:hypothetical protein